MSEPMKNPNAPESFTPKTPEILNQAARHHHPIETLVETITFKGGTLEVVKRPDVLWVGCVDYADNNEGESDIDKTLKRYEALANVPKRELINPNWGAALSINYTTNEKPNGLMLAQETYTNQQDERYQLFTQPGGLWLRVCCNKKNSLAFFGEENAQEFMYFGPLRDAATVGGYKQNPDIYVEMEYNGHAGEHGTRVGYAYIPVVKV